MGQGTPFPPPLGPPTHPDSLPPHQNRELQIMRKLDHCNIVRLRYFFYSSGEKVGVLGGTAWGGRGRTVMSRGGNLV